MWVAHFDKCNYHGNSLAGAMIDTLIEMGHLQDPNGVLITTDNSTAHGILTRTMRAKLSKAYYMRYHWIKDRILKKQFQLRWDKGSNNRPITLRSTILLSIT